MTVVKSLVKTGMTICATIHSPTPYCFNLFDTLMILLRGNVVYFGENGAPSSLIKPEPRCLMAIAGSAIHTIVHTRQAVDHASSCGLPAASMQQQPAEPSELAAPIFASQRSSVMAV